MKPMLMHNKVELQAEATATIIGVRMELQEAVRHLKASISLGLEPKKVASQASLKTCLELRRVVQHVRAIAHARILVR